jgi:Ca2+-binding EF-hand superfamily protein
MDMTISRGLVLVAAVSVLLVAAADADAKGNKKKRAAQVPAAAAAPVQSGPMGLAGSGMGGMGGMGAGQGPAAGEPFVLRHFDEIDADHNGQLSRTEIETWAAQMRAQFQAQVQERFKAADTNSDGLLSRDEARLGAPRLYLHFEFVDANGDGQVSVAELEQLRDPAVMRQRVLDRVRQADQNHDGKLNLAEMQVSFPGLAEHFSELDRDHDGFLTPDDFGGGMRGL